ncbi:hypothetical protein ACFQLX_23240 [Streptomyces polyrhachis]|uniref:DUF3592 domain-containing protein n=1 Tax=Streptomyces polyrhachis TaxID=1282885 RepID=A0ABW2GJY6_9ACTN
MSERPPRRPAPSRLTTCALLAAAALLLYVALPNIGAAIRAARADGVRGTFTAAQLECVRHPGHESCEWSGTFRPAPRGQARTATFHGGGDMKPGQSRPAVDIGLPGRVYDPQGSAEWILTAALLLAGYAILAHLARVHLMPPSKPKPHTSLGRVEGDPPPLRHPAASATAR